VCVREVEELSIKGCIRSDELKHEGIRDEINIPQMEECMTPEKNVAQFSRMDDYRPPDLALRYKPNNHKRHVSTGRNVCEVGTGLCLRLRRPEEESSKIR
jgi:hypothetical protein